MTRHRSQIGLTEARTFIGTDRGGHAESSAKPRRDHRSKFNGRPPAVRQNARSIVGYRDRVLEMGGERAVVRRDRPAVLGMQTSGAPAVIIGSIASVIPGGELGPAAGLAEVRNLGLLVHRRARRRGRRASGRPRSRRPRSSAARRRRCRRRGCPARACLDSGLEGGLADVEQPLRLGVDLPDGERVGGVGDEAVERDADVDRDHVALLEPVRPGDPVHDHRVRRRADRAREAAVALEGRDAARASGCAPRRAASSSSVVTPGRIASPSASSISATTSPARAIVSISLRGTCG